VIAIAAIAVVLAAACLWVRRRYAVVTVRGESMAPTYQPGERLLLRRTRTVKRGDCVVFQDLDGPVSGWVVKRAAAVPGDDLPAGQLTVLGDNPAHSYDSRHFGAISMDRVLGVVVRPLGAVRHDVRRIRTPI
jgi:signal peptidase I